MHAHMFVCVRMHVCLRGIVSKNRKLFIAVKLQFILGVTVHWPMIKSRYRLEGEASDQASWLVMTK